MAGASSNAPRASPSPSRSPLLGLAPDIRLRVYRHLGLASWDGAPFRFDLRGRRQAEDSPYGIRPHPIHFHSLLLSCRTIYAETAALLYAANCFVVHYYSPSQPPLGLSSLAALTDASLRSLSNLKIVLNQATCHPPNFDTDRCCRQGNEECESSRLLWCRERHRNVRQPPLLGDGALPAADAQREWHTAADRLLSLTSPGRLTLSLVCDIDPQHPLALELANAILAPIRRLPRAYLRECRIRLADKPDSHLLKQLAQDTGTHACGLPAPGTQPAVTSTLVSLPRELRLRILEYTDLVTPRKQVTWSRQDRAYVVYRLRHDEDIKPEELHADQLFECARDRTEGCFCARRHAAFSRACRCWVPPGPDLFLVCRNLCREAQYVFFSSNRFIIHDYKVAYPWCTPSDPGWQREPLPVPGQSGPMSPGGHYRYPFPRLAASEFLCDVVPASALAYIRFLELTFPRYLPETWPSSDHPAMRDWWAVAAGLPDELNLPGLTLRMIAVDQTNQGGEEELRSIEEHRTVLKAYEGLVRPLPQLAERGLARFYAHFAYPWMESPGPYPEWSEKKALKDSLERFVMGARYESMYAGGEGEPVPCDWDHMYDFGPYW